MFNGVSDYRERVASVCVHDVMTRSLLCRNHHSSGLSCGLVSNPSSPKAEICQQLPAGDARLCRWKSLGRKGPVFTKKSILVGFSLSHVNGGKIADKGVLLHAFPMLVSPFSNDIVELHSCYLTMTERRSCSRNKIWSLKQGFPEQLLHNIVAILEVSHIHVSSMLVQL